MNIKKDFNVRLISLFEITLIILSTFAFAHLVSETNSLIESLPIESQESKVISFAREKVLNYLSNGLVSAQSNSVQTCLLDNSNSSCQEYPASVCDSKCETECFPGRRVEFSPCQLGTCFDSNNGLCNSGTPKALCDLKKGNWSLQTPVQCNRECCLVNPDGSGGANQAQITTARQCNALGRNLGSPVSWVPVSGELECLAKVYSQNEGACVLDLDLEFNEYNCKFTTKTVCSTSGGQFYSGQLCSNPLLNTKCDFTENTQCFPGKDGVYFIDSCGNRANIYDDSKLTDEPYWSTVKPVTQSCVIGVGSKTQQNCGNCDYLQGSICGTPGSKDKIADSGKYVCRNLDCFDENSIDPEKKDRKHGESWCAFDGRIGVDGVNGTNGERSVDVPGSRHYRKLCFNGEIRTEPCAEYRNGLCVESLPNDLDFTTASCRTNTGILCLSQNENQEKLDKCEESADCLLKHVEVDKFKFDMCVPKYPSGFELQDQSEEDSSLICAYATNTCTYYEKKGLDGRWSCKINCDCKNPLYVETMNNLCMSLGDCGAKTNLAKEVTKNYVVTGDMVPDLTPEYIEDLEKYATPIKDQRVDGLSATEIASLFGIDPADLDSNAAAEMISQLGLGAAGAVAGGLLGSLTTTVAIPGPLVGTQTSLTNLGVFSNALSGAAVGAGIGYIVGLAFGLEGDKLTTAVVIGAVVGAVIGYGWTAIWTWLGAAGAAGPVGWIIAIVVVIIVAIISIAGVGEYREKKVTFSCLPWQPPTGGRNCETCDDNGLGCTEYKCKSLGKTCGFLNRGTDNELCIDIAPNDVSGPVININPSALSTGFSSRDSSDLGVKIVNSSGDGCLKEYNPVTFGISLNEPGQCKVSTESTPDYEAMEDFFAESNFYKFNHTDTVAMPTLDSLGVSGVDPERRGDYNLYVRCQDGSGNANDKEYVVRFCVAPANDVQPPQITKFIPESPAVAGITADSILVPFYTNEPATCRYSSEDKSYEGMENEAPCNWDLNSVKIDGWACISQLNVSQISATGNYYFRCADQPWLESNLQSSSSYTINPLRNIATESIPYTVQKTTTPLSITSTTLNGTTIDTSTQPVSVTLDITTAGGIADGKAFCRYSINGGTFVNFFETSLSTHSQTFSSLFAGNYNIALDCKDRAENTATGNVQFNIVLDNIGPLITRVYNSGTSLKVITNEASTCAYSTASCSFDFVNGTLLNGNNKVHTMPYNNKLTYRIKCQDTFGNVGTCLSVRGGY